MAAHRKHVEEAEAKGRAAASSLRVSSDQRGKPPGSDTRKRRKAHPLYYKRIHRRSSPFEHPKDAWLG